MLCNLKFPPRKTKTVKVFVNLFFLHLDVTAPERLEMLLIFLKNVRENDVAA